MKSVFLLSFFFLVIGTTCIITQNEMLPFHNPLKYHQELSSVADGDSASFFEVKEKYRTEKYWLMDMGVLTSVLGFVLLVGAVFKVRRIIAAPKFLIVTLAVVAPVAFSWGLYFVLHRDYIRNELPHWADSLGIPFIGILFFFVVSLIFTLCYLTFLGQCSGENVVITVAKIKSMNKWLLFMSALTLILIANSAYYGAWWEVFPSLLWVYFFASIGARLENKSEAIA